MKLLWLVSLLVLGVLAIPSQALATTGALEICKQATAGSGVTGTFSFLVHDTTGDRTITVAVGGCSRHFTGTGQTTITETASSGTKVDKIKVRPARRQVSQDASHGTVVVNPRRAHEVEVIFTNGAVAALPAHIELCKTLPNDPNITFQPTFSFKIDNGSPIDITAVAGQTRCTGPIAISPGDHTVAETAIPAGFEFLSVTVDPPGALVGTAGNPVTVTVSAPPATDPSAETKVTFANQITRATVEVCKSAAADSQSLLGQTFGFSATDLGLPASFTLTPTTANSNHDCQPGTAVPVLQNDGTATSGTITETTSGVTADISVTGGGSGDHTQGQTVTVTLDTTGNDVSVSFANHVVNPPSGYQCPATDSAGFAVGVTDYTTDPIFCSYPAFPGEDPHDFFCTYSATTGVLVEDHNAGFCPGNAVQSAAVAARRSAT